MIIFLIHVRFLRYQPTNLSDWSERSKFCPNAKLFYRSGLMTAYRKGNLEKKSRISDMHVKIGRPVSFRIDDECPEKRIGTPYSEKLGLSHLKVQG